MLLIQNSCKWRYVPGTALCGTATKRGKRFVIRNDLCSAYGGHHGAASPPARDEHTDQKCDQKRLKRSFHRQLAQSFGQLSR